MAPGKDQDWIPAAYVPLREQIRDELRARIISGRLEPGERLVEVTLATDLGVSRVPIREAMRLLEVEGFVEVLPRRGAIVRQLSRQDVEELFEMRTALEALACELAARRATPAEVRRLRTKIAEGKKAVRTASAEELTAASALFHDTIIEIAGNRLLSTALGPLNGRIRWLFRQTSDPVQMFEEHERILDAIAERDADRAGSLAREHVLVAKRTTMSTLFGDADEAAADAS